MEKFLPKVLMWNSSRTNTSHSAGNIPSREGDAGQDSALSLWGKSMFFPAAGAAQLCNKHSSSDLEPPTLPKPSYLVFLSIFLTFKEEWINFLSRNVLATYQDLCLPPRKKTCQENNFRRGGNDSWLNYTFKNGECIPADYFKLIIQYP